MTSISKNVFPDKLDDMVIMLEYQNIKIFLHKAIFQIDQKKVFVIKKVKNAVTVMWTVVISNQNGEEIVGTFYGKKIAKHKSKRV